MFAPWCPTCGQRTLLGPRRVVSVEAGPTGPQVVLHCFCGALLVWSEAAEGASPPSPDARAGAGCTGRGPGGTAAAGAIPARRSDRRRLPARPAGVA